VSARFVFLDRDGTLVRDHGYTHRVEDYALLPGVREGLSRLAGAGYRLAVVTNQSGIGRGYYDEAAYRAFERLLADDLARSGVRLERSFFCPHLPDAGCRCRKPEPGLLLEAAERLGADLAASWLVGDRAADAEAARRAGCRGAVLVHPDAPPPAEVPPGVPVVADVEAAARFILAHDAGDYSAP
jgi:D-glycero-D-manno-heptose 1,7-bisphosphate phosphatase